MSAWETLGLVILTLLFVSGVAMRPWREVTMQYQCSTCGKTFPSFSAMEDHKRREHGK